MPTLRAIAVVAGLVLCSLSSSLAAQELTLERIMADPDWIGRAPLNPYWADDGNAIYYFQKRVGVEELDLFRIDLETANSRLLHDDELGSADAPGGEIQSDGQLKVYTRHGDLFVRDPSEAGTRQLTRTAATESDPFFMVEGSRVAFLRDGTYLVRDLDSGLEAQPFEIRFEDDPDGSQEEAEEEEEDYLLSQQQRLFDFIHEQEENEERSRGRENEKRSRDTRRSDPVWFLGEDRSRLHQALSPGGDWLAIVVQDKDHEEGRHDTLPHFVSKDGFVENEEVRVKVGNAPAGEHLLLLQRSTRRLIEPDLSVFPEIEVDRLAALRTAPESEPGESDGADLGLQDDDEPAPRPVRIPFLQWSRDGSELLVQVFSIDNKDRWIATVDFEEETFEPLEHLFDEAWINRSFSAAGWLPDSRRFYFLSEESGYSHLYLQSIDGTGRKTLTRGRYVVCPRGANPSPHLTKDGRQIYFTANREHPGEIEVYRVGVDSGVIEQLTDLGGVTSFVLSPDEESLLLRHSTTQRPPELYRQATRPGAEVQQLTQTVSREFLEFSWARPRIVEVRSSVVDRPIYSRLYLPKQPPAGAQRPAVVFIHGAGYLQNAHKGWSGYFREFLFHSLLTERGYVVLDMDYRASAGYGRDWRTAIYRRMGTPELEDLEDGVRWLIDNHGVDPDRVGTYGGSYGGFLTLMALFQKPDLFAAGAALRPVTDWAHYNHGYTSNILNTPDVDPEAYERSSPIEFADGLSKPLLMCHGVLDDNVLFQDTARLAQRLIELGKKQWEVAMFPVERHGFREPSSWLDEYRRILELFEEHLN